MPVVDTRRALVSRLRRGDQWHRRRERWAMRRVLRLKAEDRSVLNLASSLVP